MHDHARATRAAALLAASLALHVAGAAAFLATPVSRQQAESPALRLPMGEAARPVRITLVHPPPRRRAAAQDELKDALPAAARPPALSLPDPVAPAPVQAERAPVADVPAAGAPPAAPALPGPPPRASSAEPAAPALPQEIAGHRAPALSAQAPADPSGPPAPLARSAPDAAPAVPAGVRSGAELEALPAPEYPARSRRMGEEGVVLLMVEVLPDGRAGEVRVIKDPGYPRLAEAAEAAARTARFRPATLDGKPVRSWVEIPVRFALR